MMAKEELWKTNLYTSNITKNPHVESYKILCNLTSSISNISLDIRDVILKEGGVTREINDRFSMNVYPLSLLKIIQTMTNKDISMIFEEQPSLEQPYLEKSQELDNIIFNKPKIIEAIGGYSESLYNAKNTQAINTQIIMLIGIIKEYLEELKKELGVDLYGKAIQEYYNNNHIAFNLIEFIDEN